MSGHGHTTISGDHRVHGAPCCHPAHGPDPSPAAENQALPLRSCALLSQRGLEQRVTPRAIHRVGGEGTRL
jgi:hypothetical protein